MSANPSQPIESRDRVEGWGEIAGYLRVSERTAQGREKQGSPRLPVHRDTKGRVFAYCADLDAWKALWENSQEKKTKNSEPEKVQTETVEPPADLAKTRSRPESSRLRIRQKFSLVGLGLALAVLLLVVFRGRTSKDVPRLTITAPRLLANLTSEQPDFHVLPLPRTFEFIVGSPDEKRAYLYKIKSPKIAAVDLAASVTQVFDLPREVRSVSVHPDTKRLFVGALPNHLLEVDALNGHVLSTLEAPGLITDIAPSPNGDRLYVAMAQRGVWRWSLDERAWKQITTQGCPYFSTVNAKGDRLLVSYQCGGPTGRDGHDAVEVFELPSEKSLSIYSGVPLVGTQHVFFPSGDLAWLDGGDACSTPSYDRQGCPPGFSRIHHVFRLSDQRILRSVSLPVSTGVQPRFFRGGSRVLLGSAARELRVFETARFTPLEASPMPGRDPSGGSLVLGDGLRTLILSSDFPEIWIIRARPESCDGMESGALHLLAGDGTEYDSVGNAYLEPATIYRPGLIGRAFEFNGMKGSLIRTSDDLRFGTGDSTLSLYIRPAFAQTATILESGKSSFAEGWSLRLNPKGIEVVFDVEGEQQISLKSSPFPPTDNWTQLAVTHTDSSLRLFVNGALVDEATSDHPLRLKESTMYHLGSGQTGNGFKGLIDEVSMWSRTLRDTEIRQIYDRAKTAPCR